MLGDLPAPYDNFEVEVSLDEVSGELVLFKVFIGNDEIELTSDQLNKLRSIDLATLKITHLISRIDGIPLGDEMDDYIYIYVEVGEEYVIKREGDGKVYHIRGKDEAIIDIINGRNVRFTIRKLGGPKHPLVLGSGAITK